MSNSLTNNSDLSLPTAQEAEMARASLRALAPLLGGRAAHARLSGDGGAMAELDLPPAALRLLDAALREIAAGRAAAVQAVPEELTTQQAADLLRVSRPSLIKMIDAGKLPSRKAGSHRRVRAEDVLLYLRRERARRAEVLAALDEETERLGLA